LRTNAILQTLTFQYGGIDILAAVERTERRIPMLPSYPARDGHPSMLEMTMNEPNAMIIRKAYEDFRNGNIPAVFGAFDPNITWHVPGHSPLSGDLAGHDQIAGFFQRTMELSGGAFEIDVHNVLADGDLVVALVTINAQRNGISASFPEVHFWRLKDGKAAEFREYQGDERREDRFWS
jgi:ketosteroid isomerase-like protein